MRFCAFPSSLRGFACSDIARRSGPAPDYDDSLRSCRGARGKRTKVDFLDHELCRVGYEPSSMCSLSPLIRVGSPSRTPERNALGESITGWLGTLSEIHPVVLTIFSNISPGQDDSKIDEPHLVDIGNGVKQHEFF